jgi:GTP cyclohydrolase I
MATPKKQTQAQAQAQYSEAATKIRIAFGTKNVPYEEAMMHVEAALQLLGIDLRDENFAKTPARFIKYLAEFLQPMEAPHEILGTDFATKHLEYHGMVAQANIPFRGVCAHHLLPFMGTVAIGYIPNKRVVGLSKLARLVKAVGLSTPGIQEVQTDEIADIMVEALEPKGVIVVVSATHSCMSARGVAVSNVPTITSTVRGVYRDVPAAREEFFALIKSNHLG